MTSLSPLMPDWAAAPSALPPSGALAQGTGGAGTNFAGLLDAAALAPGLPGEGAAAFLNTAPLAAWGRLALPEASLPVTGAEAAPELPAQPAPAALTTLPVTGGSNLPDVGTALPPAASPAPVALPVIASPEADGEAEPIDPPLAVPEAAEQVQASALREQGTSPLVPDRAAMFLAAAPADPAVADEAAPADDREDGAEADLASATPDQAPVPLAVAALAVKPPAALPPLEAGRAQVIAAVMPAVLPLRAQPAAAAPQAQSDGAALHSAFMPEPSPEPARSAKLAAVMTAEASAEALTQPALQATSPAPLALPAAAAAPATPMPERAAEARPAGPQLESTIAQVGDLREALRSARPAMTLQHAEFGMISLRLEPTAPDQWRAVLASRDPGFVPAMQAALDSRAIAAAGDTATGYSGQSGAHQNGTSDQRYGASPNGQQGGSQPYLGHSGSRDGEAAPDQRRPSTAAALAARGQGEAEDPAGHAQRSGGLFA